MTPLVVVVAALTVGQLPPEAKLKAGEKLADAFAIPAAYSPDGKALVFFKLSADKKGFTYWLAGADGKNPRALFASSVDWDDVLVGNVSPCNFSADGKKLAVLTTAGGKGFRADNDLLAGGFCDLEGKLHRAEVETACTGCTFAGDRLALLDSGSGDRKNRRPGYKLKLWDGKTAATVHESKDEGAAMVRAAPGGARVAFFVVDMTKGQPGGEIALRVVDLKAKTAVDSEKFRSDDVTFDGPPLFYWDAEGKGLFYHRTPDQGGKKPFALMYFDVAKKKSERLLGDDNVAVVAVLDKGHLAVALTDRRRTGILRLSDKQIFRLPEGQFPYAGTGRRLVLRDSDSREVYCAEFALPKE